MSKDLLDIFIRFVDVVIWPLVVFLLAYILRTNIQQLLNRISRLSYKDLQVELREELGAAERKSKSIRITPGPVEIGLGTSGPTVKIKPIESTKSVADERMELIRDLAEISPRSAVMMSWEQIKLTTFEIAEAFGIPFQRRRPVDDIVGKLVEHGIIDESFFGVYKPLHNLRNKVSHVHDASISEDDAERYVNLALELVSKLRKISEGSHS